MKADSRLTKILTDMLQAGIFVDPLLVNTYYREKSGDVWEAAERHAQWIDGEFVNIEHFADIVPNVPYSPALMRRCLVETLVSTGVYICNERTGGVNPTNEDLSQALPRVAKWVQERGAMPLYQMYFVVAGYDLMQPLFFHREVYESDFLRGTRHYPYSPEALDSYLLVALAMGSVRLKLKKSGRVIQPTKLGAERFEMVRDALDASDYMSRRIQMSYVYQFDTIEEWDSLCNTVWPDAQEVRNQYLSWMGIHDDDHVLEVACGTGALSLDSGLVSRLAGSGRLTATDISSGMLEQAARKLKGYGNPPHVELMQASVEHLPYSDGTFDAAMGSAFLHFTNAMKALSEMKRVVRPGGTVSVLQALRFNLDSPFFQEWFEPIYSLASRGNRQGPGSYLPTSENLVDWFQEIGLVNLDTGYRWSKWIFDVPEIVVQHLVRGAGFFQSVLVHLPWDDQRTLIMELVDRGRDVCRKYPLSERILNLPSIMIKGTRP